MLLSTAHMPDADINAWYLRGTQEVWHTRCPHCGALSDLSDPAGVFPDHSIGYARPDMKPIRGADGGILEAPEGDFVWTCPECHDWIADPQQGRYIPQNPDADPLVRSFLLPRTISPRITPRGMIGDWRNARTGEQRKSFYNRTLARPYIDHDQRPVTLAHLQAAAAEGMALGLTWETTAQPGTSYYMGIDQMMQFNCVVVLKRLPDGRQGVVHCEAVFDPRPFERCAELMERFRVSTCVVEQNPNSNDAWNFANRRELHGRVYVNTGFSPTASADMISWKDSPDRSDRKTGAEERNRWSVTIQQYKMMELALDRITQRQTLWPDPDAPAAFQDVPDPSRGEGARKRINLVRDWVWDHLTRVALIVEQDELERKVKLKVHKIGSDDPHFAFATMLANLAWAREQNTGTIFVPDAERGAERTLETPLERMIAAHPPGAPAPPMALVAEIHRLGAASPPRGRTCGDCRKFEAETGKCLANKWRTAATELACVSYIRRAA